MKNYFILSGAVLMLAGCAGLTGSKVATETVGTVCPTAGAAYSAIATAGTVSQAQTALSDAAILSPICESSTPSTALSTGAVSAFANLMAMADPLMAKTPATGVTKS